MHEESVPGIQAMAISILTTLALNSWILIINWLL